MAATRTRRGSTQVALGVAQGKRKNEFRLGVRILFQSPEAEALREDFERRTRGEADIRVIPKVEARARRTGAWFQRRRSVLEAGLSVFHVLQRAAGSLGFVVEDDEAYYALSNNHVLAGVNRRERGDPVVHPGPLDAPPKVEHLVGVVDRFVPLSSFKDNLVDCALAHLAPDVSFYEGWTEALYSPSGGLDGGGRVTGKEGLTPADIGRPVAKAGRTTGVTTGRVTQVEVDDLSVDMGGSKAMVFQNQIEVIGDDSRPFSQGGDSGSLIVDGRGKALCLLFAGGLDRDRNEDITFANPIDTVLKQLGVTLTI